MSKFAGASREPGKEVDIRKRLSPPPVQVSGVLDQSNI